jgi:SOS-response transcriptional repressor LexA
MNDISATASEIINDDPALAAEIYRILAEQRAVASGLTVWQAQALEFIRAYQRANAGVSPTVGEITVHLGLMSKSGAHRILTDLKRRKKIDWFPRAPRSISIVRSAR